MTAAVVERDGLVLTPFERMPDVEVWADLVSCWHWALQAEDPAQIDFLGVADLVLFIGCGIHDAAELCGPGHHLPISFEDGDGVHRERLIAALREVEWSAAHKLGESADDGELFDGDRLRAIGAAASAAVEWGSRLSPVELEAVWADCDAVWDWAIVRNMVFQAHASQLVAWDLWSERLPVDWTELATVVAGQGRSVRAWTDLVSPVAAVLDLLGDALSRRDLTAWFGVPELLVSAIGESVYGVVFDDRADPDRSDAHAKRVLAAIDVARDLALAQEGSASVLASELAQVSARIGVLASATVLSFGEAFDGAGVEVEAGSSWASGPGAVSDTAAAGQVLRWGHAQFLRRVICDVPVNVGPFAVESDEGFWVSHLLSPLAMVLAESCDGLAASDVGWILGCSDAQALAFAQSLGFDRRSRPPLQPGSTVHRQRVLRALLRLRVWARFESDAIAAAAAISFATRGAVLFVDQVSDVELDELPEGWTGARLVLSANDRRLLNYHVDVAGELAARHRRTRVLVLSADREWAA